jgi:hypothetical protein
MPDDEDFGGPASPSDDLSMLRMAREDEEEGLLHGALSILFLEYNQSGA